MAKDGSSKLITFFPAFLFLTLIPSYAVQPQVDAGFHTVGLRCDGSIRATGYNLSGQCDLSDWQDIIQVSAGYEHTVGLRSDGTVFAKGRNDQGQCDVQTWTNIIQVAAGSEHTVGLKSDGLL